MVTVAGVRDKCLDSLVRSYRLYKEEFFLREIIRQSRKLYWYQMKRFSIGETPKWMFDEFEREILSIGLLKAINSFDSKRGVKFSTLFSNIVRNGALNLVRGEKVRLKRLGGVTVPHPEYDVSAIQGFLRNKAIINQWKEDPERKEIYGFKETYKLYCELKDAKVGDSVIRSRIPGCFLTAAGKLRKEFKQMAEEAGWGEA